MTADEKLDKLGFSLVKEDYVCGIWIYENYKDDQLVMIDLNYEKYIIHSKTISEYTDFYGQFYNEPIGMSYEECKAFLDKIDELKKVIE